MLFQGAIDGGAQRRDEGHTFLPPQGAWQKQGWEQFTHMMPTSIASATLAHLCIMHPISHAETLLIVL